MEEKCKDERLQPFSTFSTKYQKSYLLILKNPYKKNGLYSTLVPTWDTTWAM